MSSKIIDNSVAIKDNLNVTGDTTLEGDVTIGNATSDKIGFFGVTPVDQPATITDGSDAASTQAAVNAVIDRLQELGLIAQ